MAKIRGSGTSEIPSLDLTTPLAVVDGGSGVSVSRQLAQIVTYQTGAVATGTTVIPLDDTIPQNTEGDQYMSLSITPTAINSTLEVDVTASATHGAGGRQAVCLFKDAIADALAVVMSEDGASSGQTQSLKHQIISGTTSTITFKVRIGYNNAGTTTFNGAAGARLYGGVISSRITIKEYLP